MSAKNFLKRSYTFRDKFPLKYCMISTSRCNHMLTISREADICHVSRVTCISTKFGPLKLKKKKINSNCLRFLLLFYKQFLLKWIPLFDTIVFRFILIIINNFTKGSHRIDHFFFVLIFLFQIEFLIVKNTHILIIN